MSRYLFVIPHYYTHVPDSDLGSQSEPRQERAQVVARTITGIHETFGRSMSVFPGYRSPDTPGHVVDVVVVTTPADHLVADIGESARLVRHLVVDDAPMTLGFAAHRVLADAVGTYDRYAFMEDDLVVHDPLLFAKQDWFRSMFGSAAYLGPTRYEASGGLKVHPDGPLPDEATAGLRQPPGPDRLEGDWFGLHLVFERPSNPHSACFFVDNDGLERLCAHPRFGVPHASIERTLETAATGLIAETFCVYKASPSCADFLEVEHQGSRYLGDWATPEPVHVVEALRVAAEVRADEAEARVAAAEARVAAAEARVAAAEARVAAAEARIATAEERAATAESRADTAGAAAAALAATTETAEARAVTAEYALDEIRASRSWRLTAPLRRVSGVFHRH